MSPISMALAAARQAAALAAYSGAPQPPPQVQAATASDAQPITPAKPPGTGLLVDTRA